MRDLIAGVVFGLVMAIILIVGVWNEMNQWKQIKVNDQNVATIVQFLRNAQGEASGK